MRRAPCKIEGVPRRLLALIATLAALAASCSSEPEKVVEAPPPPAPLSEALALLPADASLRRQILFGDLERLRASYVDADSFRGALAGVWLPDALVGAGDPLWRKSYGFGLGSVDRFVSGGFHPLEVTVAVGRFEPRKVQATLQAHGYTKRGPLMKRGADGSVDAKTAVGRLSLSSLDRVAVDESRLVAASTAALAKAALSPAGSDLGADLQVAAGALGRVTSAVVLPPELVRPPTGVPVRLLAAEPATLVAVGIDDRGRANRTVRIVLVYAEASQAESEAGIFASTLAAAPLTTGGTFGDLFDGLSARAVHGRVVVVSGRLAAGQTSGRGAACSRAGTSPCSCASGRRRRRVRELVRYSRSSRGARIPPRGAHGRLSSSRRSSATGGRSSVRCGRE